MIQADLFWGVLPISFSLFCLVFIARNSDAGRKMLFNTSFINIEWFHNTLL